MFLLILVYHDKDISAIEIFIGFEAIGRLYLSFGSLLVHRMTKPAPPMMLPMVTGRRFANRKVLKLSWSKGALVLIASKIPAGM